MKILAVADFDAAGVLHGHQRILRALGVDYRIAVRDAYWTEHRQADYWAGGGSCDFAALSAFAAEADRIVFCPGIGQPWSHQTTDFLPVPEIDDDFYGLAWPSGPRRTAYFLGSVNAFANAERYAEHYRARGYDLWAVTPDYVERMSARYVPGVVTVPETARLRESSEPLRVVHAVTDKRIAGTDGLAGICREAGVDFDIIHGIDHAAVFPRKAHAHVALEAFGDPGTPKRPPGISAMESTGMGLAVIQATDPRYRTALEHEFGAVLPWPWCETLVDVRAALVQYRNDPAAVRIAQRAGRDWFVRCMDPVVRGNRLMEVYGA